jgi:secreted trypsin-like serine protease
MLLRRKLPVLWATLVGALVAAMVVAFFVFVQSGEATPQAADEQPSASASPKIVGGTEVSDGKYPFIALMNIQVKSDGTFWNSCGASLIDQDSVLTAAHCLVGVFDPKKHKLQVYVGRTVRSSNQGQVRDWKSISIHPNYNPQNSAYDAAVINLGRAVMGITPINLATSTQNNLESPGSKATVAGWGNTFANPPDPPGPSNNPDRMHEAQVPIYSDASAQQALRQRDIVYLPPLMIGAGGKEVDSCQGDSGGPLFTQVSGKYTQIGIVSSGYGCGAGTPGIYTEVNNPSIRDFITTKAATK